ncbi:hypothetical protein BGW80DRAFT_1486223, partial [Lactifluus volemus]
CTPDRTCSNDTCHVYHHLSPFPLLSRDLLVPDRNRAAMAPRPTIRGLLIDLSGTIYTGTQPIPGSAHAIQRLRASSIPFRFCSITSKESTAALRSTLAKMGIETHDNEVRTSIGAVILCCEQRV